MDMKTALAVRAAAGEVLSAKQVNDLIARSPADVGHGASPSSRSERTVSLG